MKKTLLFIAALAVASIGYSQTELVRNGTCDEHGTGSDTSNTSDNADAWDMTPNSTLNGDIVSPYRYDADNNPTGWRNQDLEDALEVKYGVSSIDEQPGSTSSGRDGTRGVKLYDDGSPAITGSSRRLYQLVPGLTIGNIYKFSIDSKSEAANTPSEVYILNNQIADESGIDANKYSDSSVVAGMDITNDEGTWVTNTMSFVATTTEVVIYVRANGADSGDTEVFYDNISLQMDDTGNTVTPLTTAFGSGYINTFNVSDDAYQFGFGYPVADMKTTIDATSVTLQPNFGIWTAEDGNAAWFDTSSGKTPILWLDASSYTEPSGLNDANLTFKGNVSAHTIDAAYKVVAFIKALDPNDNWATVVNEFVELTATGDFSVSATGTQLASGLVVQYGFTVSGVPADPANENALGSVVVGEQAVANVGQEIFQGFKMYPNPTSNMLNISSNNAFESASIHNLLGQKVRSISIDDTKASIDVSNLTSGIYIVKISNGSEEVSRKFIKN